MKKQISVAQYLEQLIALSPMSQKEMAEKAGYDKPNMITMIKQGRTKLPLNKIAVFAEILGIDKVHLLRIVLQEYLPEVLEILEDILGKSMITESEMKLVKAVRSACKGLDIDFLGDQAQITKLVTDALAPLVESELKEREGAAAAIRR